ncbi:hypothetical protein GCM10011505_16840 [Tistrella bauzanensis]|uniref:Carrier domain-containing protein n=1 Tax=Tistrella bauzanensis TaxID=657419 RepID=A0ABQ1IEN9_9PROT|nr:non-ribosomal peptide synthetase [Tistrella bauzanensis]GGB36005.1 hypothetical protein GCM10011505_16840 [Tistrella bauzanensis]
MSDRSSAAELRDRLRALTPEQRAALERRLAAAKRAAPADANTPRSPGPTGTAGAAPIPHVPRDQPLPASFAQERLWFIDQLAPGTAAYNMPAALRLAGQLDVAALATCFARIVARHEALRTSLIAHDGRPVQVIAPPPSDWPLTVEDMSGADPLDIQARVAAEAAAPFDLASPLKLRTRLIRLATDEHLLLLTLHHVASDGWSIGVLTAEIGAQYAAALDGRPDPLPPLACQYGDVAAWQRARLSGPVMARELDHWRRTLDGFVPGELPMDRPRPPVQQFDGATINRRLPAALARRVTAAARAAKATPFIILLAAFNAFMARFSGETDVSVGIPVANRTHPDVEALIGFFVNALVVRVPLTGDPAMAEIFQRTRQAAMTAYDHQDLPFERLVAELQPERDPARPPLFRIAFAVQNAATGGISLPGLRLSPFEAPITQTRMDMEWHVFERAKADGAPAGFDLVVAYATALYDHDSVAAMIDAWIVLLDAGLDHPDMTLSALPLLDDAGLARAIARGRGAASPPSPADDLGRSTLAVAAQAGDRPALIGADGTVCTYRQLAARATAIAAGLHQRGVGAEDVVLVLADRGPDQIATTLGIWLAGACHLPVDPAQPDARLALMLATGRPRLVLSDDAGLARLASPAAASAEFEAPAVADIATIGMADEAPVPSIPAIDAARLAYIIFTSGSTGTPKGAMLSHGGLLNTALAQIRQCGIGPDDRVAQIASPGFDAALSEMMMALLAGATLVPVPADVARDPAALACFLTDRAITVATLTPSMLAAIDHDLPQIRVLLVAGEACPAALVRRHAPGRRLVNAYGPTEISVCATMDVDIDADDVAVLPPSIGSAIDGVEILILDRHGRIVPDGVAGELCIGGQGVGRGYVRRPGLTADRFMPHPSAGRPGARLYRSGDLVRRRIDGRFDYLGRIDTQVKLGGNRIEPGEIEAVLRQDPAVADAVVGVVAPASTMAPDTVADAGADTARNGPPIAIRPAAALADGRRLELWPSIAEHFVYDETLYHAMTHDEARNAHYRAAIRAAVPGRIVVEIGTGADAILARFCAEAGAAHVYAIELLESSASAATETVRRLGLADRITVIHGDARRVSLPEPADLCVSEIIGPIGGCEGSAVILNDAWRLLKPEGTMIPARTRSMVAGVELPQGFRDQPGFTSLTAGYVRRIFQDRGGAFDLRLCIKGLTHGDLLTDAGVFEDLDHAGPVATESRHDLVLTATRDGHLTGLLVWLNLHARPDVVMDTLGEICCWLPVFLPAFGDGRKVTAGTRIYLTIDRRLHANGINPDFHLTGRIETPDGDVEHFDATSPNHPAPGGAADFRATPFYRRLFPEISPAGRDMDGIADRRLVAWVTRRPGADPQGDAVLARDRVAEWRALYETAGPADTAGADSGIADPADDDALFAGWNSSYTGRAIPAAEMRRWRDQTVAAIRRLFPAAHPPHLVEIGCGAGLLLDPLAEHVASCLGTDFSAATLAGLEARLAVRAASGTTAAPIRLLRQEAADPLPLDGVTADLVVMNSVAQYFPGPDHLLQVLTRIGEALAGRGAAFIGDIRDHGLAAAFHASVLAHSQPGPADAARARAVTQAVLADEELMLDPAWFHGLTGRLPGLAHVEIALKRGADDNELVRFRYDVALVFGSTPDAIAIDSRYGWDSLAAIGALERRLAETTGAIEITGIPNARLVDDCALAQGLGLIDTRGNTGLVAMDPEMLWQIAERLGRPLRLAPAASGDPAAMDALFDQMGAAQGPHLRAWIRQPRPRDTGNRPSLTNDPLARRRDAALADRLRTLARSVLPGPMVPASVMVVERMPLTASGKIDRKSLPVPDTAGTARQDRPRSLPADRLEATLVEIWEAMLGTAPIGVDEDFFALGGHSLLGVRLVAEVKARFGQAVPLDLLMRAGTVRDMADHLRRHGQPDGAGHDAPGAGLVPLRRAGRGLPVFCLPPGGGTVFCYAPLVQRLAPGRPVYGLQAAGVEPGEAPHETLAQMAQAYIAAVRRVQPHGPYHLIGWSFGGHVAHEIAATLQADGETVAVLALLDTFPPEHVPRVEDRYRRDEAFLAYLAGLAGLAVIEAELEPLDHARRVALVAARAVAAGALPAHDAEGTVDRLLALCRISGRLAREAELGHYDGPLTFLRAAEALTPELASLAGADPSCGWAARLGRMPAVETVPGRHDTMVFPPHVDRLAAVIDRLLAHPGHGGPGHVTVSTA